MASYNSIDTNYLNQEHNRSTHSNKEGELYEIIELNHPLKHKIRPTGGRSMKEITNRADTVYRKMSNHYKASLDQQIVRLWELSGALSTIDDSRAQISEISRVTQDIKGNAPFFNFPLMGKVCDSMNQFLQSPHDPKKRIPVVKIHVDTLVLLKRENIQSENDSRGRELYQQLRTAVDRLTS